VASTLDAAVEQYAGDAGETVLAADASYLDFDSRIVAAGVEEAERELQAATDAVVTDAQRETVERLQTMTRFLRTATETQISLVDAYFHLTRAREALAARDDGAAERAATQMDVKRRIARGPYSTLVDETNAAATAVLSQLDARTYRRKRAQFDAEMRAFGRIRGPLDEFVGAVGRLESARALRRNGSTEQATETAANAVEGLEAAASALAAFTDGLDGPADALGGIGGSLETLAVDMAAAAREQYDLSETPAPA
jgi:hypothetical protein